MALSQEEIRFHSEISADTVFQGERFEISFLLEGAEIKNIQTPDLEGFQIFSGPNQTSQMQFMNGKMSRRSSYSFVLLPESSGIFVLEPAIIQTESGELRSESVRIVVLPNPNGFQPLDQVPKQKKSPKQKGKVYTMWFPSK